MMPTVLSSLALCLSMFFNPLQVASRPSPRENVGTAILEAIRLLESKDYKTFLMEFIPPDVVKARTASPAALNEWVEGFAAHSVGFLLPRLKEASKLTPTYDGQKTTATFQLKDYDGTKWFKMVKIDRYWYVEPNQ